MDNKHKLIGVQAVSTTEVLAYLNEFKGRQPVVRLIRATGNHASSKLTFYVPEVEYRVRLAAAATNVATDYYVPVDAAGGHVVSGLTVDTNDYLLLPGSSGWVIEAITAVTDDAGQDYCHLSVGTTSGKALTVRDEVFIVRAEMVHDVTIGVATIEKTTFPFAGNVGCPMVVSATSGDTSDTDVIVDFEYLNTAGV